jgi:hypothetical protein
VWVNVVVWVEVGVKVEVWVYKVCVGVGVNVLVNVAGPQGVGVYVGVSVMVGSRVGVLSTQLAVMSRYSPARPLKDQRVLVRGVVNASAR